MKRFIDVECVCVCVYTYVCVCVYIYIYIYIYMWWRVLTKRGPLKKVIANNYSILALRTP